LSHRIRPEVLTEEKILDVFWVIASCCGRVGGYQRFAGTHCLCLHGRNQYGEEAAMKVVTQIHRGVRRENSLSRTVGAVDRDK
jgi:hypothetical protein